MIKITLTTAAILAYCILHTANCFSQGTAINKTGAAADCSAILDLSDTTKGILIPRMKKVNKLAIASPATGLMVYQTDDTTGFWYYSGTKWMQASGQAGAGGSSSGNVYYGTPGTYYWTVPTGVTTVYVSMCGGGGGGGGGAWGGGYGGGGGGADAVRMNAQAVTPGSQVTVIVGGGGAAGSNGPDSPCPPCPGTTGGNGGSSSFNGTLITNGGIGGSPASYGGTAGGGAAGGAGGADGTNSYKGSYVSYAGYGGSSMFGSGGISLYGTSRQNPVGYGAGGHGAIGPYNVAAAGKPGFVKIEW